MFGVNETEGLGTQGDIKWREAIMGFLLSERWGQLRKLRSDLKDDGPNGQSEGWS